METEYGGGSTILQSIILCGNWPISRVILTESRIPNRWIVRVKMGSIAGAVGEFIMLDSVVFVI